MTETPIGFGIIGSGNMARVYADALATQVTGGRLTAIALGTRAESLASEFGVATEPSAESLAARPDVDVVVIATPHSTHLPLALEVAAAGKHVYLEKPMALDVAECDQIIDACNRARRPADDRQADPPHGDVDAGQGLRRRGADRRDPVPPADERDARIGLRQRPAELAVRSARGRRLPRLGRPRLRRRPLVHRRRAGPRLRGLRQLHRPAPREPDGDGPGPPVEQGDRPDPAVLRDRTVRVRDPAQQPVPDRRHGGVDLLGPRPGRAAHRGARRARVGAAELDPPRLQAT